MKVIFEKRQEQQKVEINEAKEYNFTNEMQIETARVSKQVEIMLIIGKKKNENSNTLYEVARRLCNNAMIIETMDDLYINYIKRFKIVGLVVAEKMPEYLVKRIVEILQNTQTEGYMYESSR